MHQRQRMAKLVEDNTAIFAFLGLWGEPAIVHTRLVPKPKEVGLHAQALRGTALGIKADTDIRLGAFDKLKSNVGDRLHSWAIGSIRLCTVGSPSRKQTVIVLPVGQSHQVFVAPSTDRQG